MKINKRIVVTISILAASTMLLGGAVAVPTVLSIKKLNAMMAAATDEIDQKYLLRKHTRTSLSKLQEAKEKLRELSSFAIVEGDELNFVSSLEAAADSAGIKQSLVLETVNQQEISPWEKDVPVKIDAEGDYRDITVYLRRLESLPYYLAVRSISIGVPQQREAASQGRVKLRLEASVRWIAKDQPVFKQIDIEAPEELPGENQE